MYALLAINMSLHTGRSSQSPVLGRSHNNGLHRPTPISGLAVMEPDII